MSKVCMNCGNQMDDNTMFCTNCGAEVPTPVAAPAPQKAPKVDVGEVVKKVKKNPKMLIIIGAAAVVVLAVIIALLWNPLFNPWKKGMDNYVDLVVHGKANVVTKAAPKEVWEYVDDKAGISKDDVAKDKKDYAKDASEDMKETYGDNVKFTYKVIKSKKMTKEMVEAYGEALDNAYEIDKDSVKAGYVVQYEYEINGKESFDWGEGWAYFVKIDNGWYKVSSVDVDEEDPYCSISALSALQNTETFEKEAKYD